MRAQAIRISGEWWLMKLPGDPGCDNNGLCDYENKTIYIRDGLGQLKTVEVIVHETVHAVSRDLSEECVERIGVAVAGALQSAGMLAK